jgi:hypothetical protein
MSLCLEDHNIIHNSGTSTMASKYLQVRSWLKRNGWEQDFRGKWFHEEEGPAV